MSRRHKFGIFSRRSESKKDAMNHGTQNTVSIICTTPAVVISAAATAATPILASILQPLDPVLDLGTTLSFPSFKILPTEIRLRIWQTALPIRILPVQPLEPSSATSFVCTEPPPVLLSVCRESRHETLRFYVVVSDKPKGYLPPRYYANPSLSQSSDHRFYFNPYNDTIFLDVSREGWLRILRIIESHSGILSLAFRNAHRRPRTVAIEVSAKKGVKEMFVVGDFEGFGWTPEVWKLLPRERGRGGGGVMSGEGYCGGVVECIERWDYVEDRMPSVTAVKEDFWMREGLGVVGRW